jgi:hypothetical protein
MSHFFNLLPNAQEAKLFTVYPAILMTDIPATFNTAYGFNFDYVERTGIFIEDEFGQDEKVIIKKGAKCGVLYDATYQPRLMSPRGGPTLATGKLGVDWLYDPDAFIKD